MNEKYIRDLFDRALRRFNYVLGTEYTSKNVCLVFYTSDNLSQVYRESAELYGFFYSRSEEENMSDAITTAFPGKSDCDDPEHKDTVLLRTDLPEHYYYSGDFFHDLIHELSHIYCTTHETDTACRSGQRFYDLYCSDAASEDTITNGFMNAGYAVWREFIAEIMADWVDQMPSNYLYEVKDYLLHTAEHISLAFPNAKLYMSRYLSVIMNSFEGSQAEQWSELEEELTGLHLPFISMVRLVFDNLHDGLFYTITSEFIKDLGQTYLKELLKKAASGQ